MDAEMLKLKAHIDQTRSEVRQIVLDLGPEELARLVKVCAAARLGDLDERAQRLVGALAIVSVFNLIEKEES